MPDIPSTANEPDEDRGSDQLGDNNPDTSEVVAVSGEGGTAAFADEVG